MSLRNESTSAAPSGVAEGMGELTRDVVSLAELQVELFRNDCSEGVKGLPIPVTLLLVAGAVAVGTVPIALLLVTEVLVHVIGLSRVAAFAFAALSGFSVAVALGVVGWFHIRKVGRVFERSREELIRNVTWIKDALKPPASIESQRSQER